MVVAESSGPTSLEHSHLFEFQAAETIVLVAAMLYAGTANQQKEAQAFVEADLSMHDKEVSEGLIEKLKGTVKIDEGDVWVSTMWKSLTCRSLGANVIVDARWWTFFVRRERFGRERIVVKNRLVQP